MSPVFSSACHWNKEYQYFYINNRWVKGKDPSTAIINQIYSALLRQQQFGPTAQHSEANRNVFPCFVLQLKCAVDKYDILVEPDKSFPIFCDSASIERCSYGLVHHIISTHNPEMLETLIKQEIFPIDDSYDTSNDSEPVMEISYPVSSTQETSSNSGVSEPFLPYQVSIVKKSDARQSNSSNYQNSMDQYRYDQCISPPPILDFDTAFFGGESKYKRNYKKRKPAAASNNWRLRQELLPSIKSLAKLDSWEAGMEDYFSETESLSPLIRKEAISSAIGVTVKRLGSFSSIFDSYRQPSLRETEPIQIANPNQHTEVQQEEQDLRSTQNPQSQKKKDSNNFQFSENENTSALDVTRFTVHDHQQRFLRGKTFESPPREVTELVERNSFQASENLSLSKNKLKKIQFIGQCDNKYLLGYEKYHGLLVAFDQHAVDERINFEKFQKRLNEEIWMNDLKSIKILPQPLYIQKDRLDLLDAYSQLFQRWKFSFELSNCSGENTQVMLSEVPIISGEPLDSKDFLEFFHFVYKNGDVPEQLLRPPAVNRILASKACRLSIKFGDNLEEANCRDLLETLSQTDCPFYCAHGRPAVIPLLSLVESKKVEFLKKNTSQSNKNRFKPNYQNAIESLKKCKRK